MTVDIELFERFLPKIGAAPMCTYLALLKHLNRTTLQCNPSMRLLAKETGFSLSTVRRAIRKLSSPKVGMITCQEVWQEQGRQTSNEYTITDPTEACRVLTLGEYRPIPHIDIHVVPRSD